MYNEVDEGKVINRQWMQETLQSDDQNKDNQNK